MDITTRKGAKRISEIPEAVLEALNRGVIQTLNLVEWLALDQTALLKNVLIPAGQEPLYRQCIQAIQSLKKPTVNTISQAIGHTVAAAQQDAIMILFKHHLSDTVRQWGAYATAHQYANDKTHLLEQIKPFATDAHFAVREIAWMAARPHLTPRMEESIDLLMPFAQDSNENARRFATEVTRPRGVWCAHIPVLKTTPEIAIPLLSVVMADPSRYVQNSVANWLNDAAKSRPDFVSGFLCSYQNAENKASQYIVKRASRSL